MNTKLDVLIIGGGLAGLWSAVALARRGLAVRVLERRMALGGRAISDGPPGYRMNLGPHALYRRSFALPLLESVGVKIQGGVPSLSGNLALFGERIEALPTGWMSLATTPLLDGGARWAFMAAMARAMRAHPEPQQPSAASQRQGSIGAWLDANVHHPAARALVSALVRVTSYTNDEARYSAASALDQLRRGLRGNVLYLHEGWSHLIDQLRALAIAAGAEIMEGVTATAIAEDGEVLTSSGPMRAARVLACLTPDALAHLLPGSAQAKRWATDAIPVRAAILDVALDALPAPQNRFALGIDRPLYFSVHSLTASRLAPAGGAVIHLARYGGEGPDGPAELEALLDRLQPGWRAHVVERRYMPRLTVQYDLPVSGQSTAGPRVSDRVLVAGDWVGGRGMLADRALASAEEAVHAIVAELDADRRVS